MRHHVVNLIASSWENAEPKPPKDGGPGWVFIVFLLLCLVVGLLYGVPAAIMFILG